MLALLLLLWRRRQELDEEIHSCDVAMQITHACSIVAASAACVAALFEEDSAPAATQRANVAAAAAAAVAASASRPRRYWSEVYLGPGLGEERISNWLTMALRRWERHELYPGQLDDVGDRRFIELLR